MDYKEREILFQTDNVRFIVVGVVRVTGKHPNSSVRKLK